MVIRPRLDPAAHHASLDACGTPPYARPMHEANPEGGGEDTPSVAPLASHGVPVPIEPPDEAFAESVHADATWGDEAPEFELADTSVDPDAPPILVGLG